MTDNEQNVRNTEGRDNGFAPAGTPAFDAAENPCLSAGAPSTGGGGFPPYPYYAPYKRPEQDEILEHTSTRRAFAVVLLCWLFGVLFSGILLRGGFGLSVPLLTALFYAVAFFCFAKKRPLSRESVALLAPIGLLSLGFALHDNGMVYFVNILLLLALIPLQLTRMSGTSAGPVFSVQSALHTVISALARPLEYLDTPFKALSRNIRSGMKGSRAFIVLLGLVIALPVAAVLTALFVQADSAFGYFYKRLADIIDLSFANLFLDILIGTVIGIFVSAWFITMRARKSTEPKELRLPRGADGLLTATVLVVINAVVLSFVAVQFSYLFAGVALPNGMTYAEYARSGFFELCAALCVCVAIVVACMIFTRKDAQKKLPRPVSLLLTLFIACNYVIIASAVYRMLTYIGQFDLTVKRVMVTWLIGVFALCLIGAAIKAWLPRFDALRYAAVVVIALSVAVNAVNINAFIAEYNVTSYLESLKTGRVRDIDVDYLGALGPSAAEATLRLYREGDDAVRQSAKTALEEQKWHLVRKSWKNACLPDVEAKGLLAEFEPKKRAPENEANG